MSLLPFGTGHARAWQSADRPVRWTRTALLTGALLLRIAALQPPCLAEDPSSSPSLTSGAEDSEARDCFTGRREGWLVSDCLLRVAVKHGRLAASAREVHDESRNAVLLTRYVGSIVSEEDRAAVFACQGPDTDASLLCAAMLIVKRQQPWLCELLERRTDCYRLVAVSGGRACPFLQSFSQPEYCRRGESAPGTAAALCSRRSPGKSYPECVTEWAMSVRSSVACQAAPDLYSCAVALALAERNPRMCEIGEDTDLTIGCRTKALAGGARVPPGYDRCIALAGERFDRCLQREGVEARSIELCRLTRNEESCRDAVALELSEPAFCNPSSSCLLSIAQKIGDGEPCMQIRDHEQRSACVVNYGTLAQHIRVAPGQALFAFGIFAVWAGGLIRRRTRRTFVLGGAASLACGSTILLVYAGLPHLAIAWLLLGPIAPFVIASGALGSFPFLIFSRTSGAVAYLMLGSAAWSLWLWVLGARRRSVRIFGALMLMACMVLAEFYIMALSAMAD